MTKFPECLTEEAEIEIPVCPLCGVKFQICNDISCVPLESCLFHECTSNTACVRIRGDFRKTKKGAIISGIRALEKFNAKMRGN